ncbi:MAG: DUF3343 domain-containing protein [Deltaproteobacteria bacterium]
MDFILAFGGTHRVLKAEAALKRSALNFRLLPAPKELSKYCGLVISLKEEHLGEALVVLKEAGLEPKAIYMKEGGEYVKM